MPSTYRPTALTFNNTAFRGGKPYNAADIPIPGYMVSPGVDRTILEQQFAYEWYDQSGRYASGRNPPFTHASAGRLLPDFTSDGQPRRILRGFIRRSEYDVADSKSTARLYFMYNPEVITREYVSYLDQGALDPFNTVFQSGNLVPPPSFMDFNFSLLFDRQEEASQDGSHPGVFVDYEYFDLVVRNVIPSYDPGGTSTGGSELPDNGVMMVNPRDITVVFSPNITVQGRPSNARVTFQKFTHRMIPIRMQIDLTMRVTYFGPNKDMQTYEAEQATSTDSVPWNVQTASPFHITNEMIDKNARLFMEDMSNGEGLLTAEQIEALWDEVKAGGGIPDNIDDIINNNTGASGDLNQKIADYALQRVTGTTTIYRANDRRNLWTHADCSSYIWAIFASFDEESSPAVKMGWGKFKDGLYSGGDIPGTDSMISKILSQKSPCKMIFQNQQTDKNARIKDITPNLPLMMPGDLLFRKAGVVSGHDGKGHVALVYSNNPSGNTVDMIHCGTPDKPAKRQTTQYSYIASDYTDCWRPMLGNPDSPGNNEGGGD
jgi:hypothetical protein